MPKPACENSKDPDMFWSYEPLVINIALAVCAKCEVKAQCLEQGLKHEPDGIWGGTTPEQRQVLRRKNKIALQRIRGTTPAAVK